MIPSEELLGLALLGLNPDRTRRILEGGRGAVIRELQNKRGGQPAPRPWPSPGVEFLTPDRLPPQLAATPDSPPWLFSRGELPGEPAVAVVGARRATRYGLELAHEIGRRLGRAGWPVVSGLALGIDAAVHRGCLDGGGVGVAVLGSGIDVWYPKSNRELGDRLLAGGGAIVSEFGPGVAPEPWRFPFRNRIISGLSSVVIVVEAARRSGALITANAAISHGREVIAVPGDIDRPTSVGCNLLVRDGAHPLVDLDEMIELLEFWLGPAPRTCAVGIETMLGVLPASIGELAARTGLELKDVMVELVRLQAVGTVQITEGVVRAR